MTQKNFVVHNGLTVGNIILDVAQNSIDGAHLANIANLNVSTLANLGDAGNIKIGGGLQGQLLQTDGNGNLSWYSFNPDSGLTCQVDVFTGTGNTNSYTLSLTPVNVNFVSVVIDGVTQLRSTYSLVNNILTIGANLPQLARMEVTTLVGYGNSALQSTVDNYVGNGNANTYLLSVTPPTVGSTTVVVDGVVQMKNSYSLNESNITLGANLPSGSVLEVTTLQGSNTAPNVANYANYANFAGTANVANSVSVSNVSGIGNVATINLNGNLSQVLNGNGGWIEFNNVANANYAPFSNIANTANSVTWANVTGAVSPQGEIHVAKNGNDTTGNGTLLNPYVTIGKAVSMTGSGSDIILHPGEYNEDVTIANLFAVTLSSADTGGAGPFTPAIYGNLTVNGNSGSIAVKGIGVLNTVTHSASGSLFITNMTIGSSGNVGTLNKSGSGYLSVKDSSVDITSGANLSLANITGGNTILFSNVAFANLVVSNSAAQVTVSGGSTTLMATLTAGTLNVFESYMYTLGNSGFFALSSTGGTVNIKNSTLINPNLTPARVNLSAGTIFAYGDVFFDRANSNLGIQAGTTVDFQALRVANGVTSSTLSVSGNANVGNIGATNFVGGGSSLTSINGANVSGQVSNAAVAGTVYTAAQPNITSVGNLTTLTVAGTTISRAIIPDADNAYTLGNANYRWSNLWVGPGTIYITDSNNSANTAQLTVYDGILQVNGATGLQANLIAGNTTLTMNSNANIIMTVGGVTTTVANSGLTTGANVSAQYFKGDGSLLTGIAPTVQVYEFANIASGVSTYLSSQWLGDFTPGAQANITTTVTTTATLLSAFITEVGHPNITVIPIGTIATTVKTKKASGNRIYTLYVEHYKRTTGGTETLITTSELGDPTQVNTTTESVLTAYISSPYSMDVTDRIVTKIYAYLDSGSASIALQFDDNTNTGLQLPALPASASQFIPYTGATANIDLGTNSITANVFTGNVDATGTIKINNKQAVNGPAFSAYANSATQTIPTTTQTKVLFQTEEFDTNNNFANSRFTPSVEGYYQLNAEVRVNGSSGTGEMMIVIWKNGSEIKRGTNQQGVQIATDWWAMTVNSLVYANGSSDYFEIAVQQGSGSNRDISAVNNPSITWFNGAMVRGA